MSVLLPPLFSNVAFAAFLIHLVCLYTVVVVVRLSTDNECCSDSHFLLFGLSKVKWGFSVSLVACSSLLNLNKLSSLMILFMSHPASLHHEVSMNSDRLLIQSDWCIPLYILWKQIICVWVCAVLSFVDLKFIVFINCVIIFTLNNNWVVFFRIFLIFQPGHPK